MAAAVVMDIVAIMAVKTNMAIVTNMASSQYFRT